MVTTQTPRLLLATACELAGLSALEPLPVVLAERKRSGRVAAG